MKTKLSPCPCGNTKSYADCCARYLGNDEIAPSPEALMRSRYTAYTLLHEDYLLATWHQSTRPPALGLQNEAATKWLGLEVKRHEQQDTEHAIVEFVARCKVNGRAHRLHEISRFVCEEGKWFYVDGQIG
ncbi:MAG: YchJ family metal-binding protein [Gallionellaceae bacterium]